MSNYIELNPLDHFDITPQSKAGGGTLKTRWAARLRVDELKNYYVVCSFGSMINRTVENTDDLFDPELGLALNNSATLHFDITYQGAEADNTTYGTGFIEKIEASTSPIKGTKSRTIANFFYNDDGIPSISYQRIVADCEVVGVCRNGLFREEIKHY